MKLNRVIRAAGVAVVLAAIAANASAALAVEDSLSSANQVQYERLHASAVAFTESLSKIAERYGPIQGASLDQARDLITRSEQAAQRSDFAQASQQAKTAYELLRTAITEAVARSRSPN